MRFACIVTIVAGASAIGVAAASSQFHLSFVEEDNGQLHYMLDWVTASTANSSRIIVGASADKLDSTVDGKSAGLVTEAAGETVACWSALLANLEPGSTIFYALESDATEQTTSSLNFDTLAQSDGSASNDVMSFTVPDGEITWAVFGDMGAPMQGHAAAVSLPALKSALSDGAYSGVLNIGDLSYELTGSNGQDYMNELESITSRVPMMTTVGNHEYQYALSPALAVQNYYRRFHGITLGAGAASGSSSNEFYSFSSGLIHFVFINTEVYGDEAYAALQDDGTWKVDESARKIAGTAQAKWLEYDLSRVKRSETPYIVLCGHRPPFKTPKGLSETGNRFAKEIVPLMSKYQVDLYLAGHEHTYLMFEASTFNGYNIPPIIISGSPGNNEYIREEAELDIVGFKWKTLIPKYGYGYLTATKTALKWQWGSAATDSTHEPSSAMWKKQDEVSFPKQTIESAYTAAGSAVSEPIDVAGEWVNTSSGERIWYRSHVVIVTEKISALLWYRKRSRDWQHWQ
ncbi:Calcineurin-like phosphoesterase [Phytophthora palmivora]|uniref:Purple acid phosphatase n=1 Tax=Phytophthora palmivora TaxID=4796 RepID=A0A2P4XYL7_9STRA|nr:Calcineurin-like phosphoesterase [Phytophthora palmivora]